MPKLQRLLSSSIEALEFRIAPATISATLTNGVLKIATLSPSTGAIASVTAIDPDSFLVSDGPTPLGQFDGVHSVKLIFGDQIDTLSFLTGAIFRGPVSISAGDGADVFSFGAAAGGGISGDVTVTAKGATTVFVNNSGHISGALNVTTGAGGTVALGSGGGVGSLTTKDVPQIILDQTSNVAGNVRLTAPLSGITVTAGGIIQGGLVVVGSTSPSSPDIVHLNGSTYGPVSLVFGEGGSLVDTQNSNSFFIGDSLSISGKSGPDMVNLHLNNSGNFAVGIAGAVKISLGDGTNSISIDGQNRISGGLRTIGGTGNDTVSITNATVGGMTRFDLGGGTNSVTMVGTLLNGGLVVTSGAGDDTIQMNPQNAIAGAAKFSLGDGLNSTTIAVGIFDAGLTVTGGKDNDLVSLGGSSIRGRAMFSLGEGTNSFISNSSIFRTTFTYVGLNAGNDSVTIDANSTLSGTFTMNAGDGSNLLIMNTLGDLSSLSYKGGKDSDTVVLEAGGGISNSNPGAGQYIRGKVVLRDGGDSVYLRNSRFLTFSFDGGAGVDTMNHTVAALASLPIEKAFETTNVIP